MSLSTTNVAAARDALAKLPDVASVEVDPQDQRITAFPRAGKQIFAPVSDLLRQQGIAVTEVQLERGRLDEVFRTVTQGKREEAAA